MEEDLPKRNTDCVYFLASPLTCKKGIECEYRHSKIARLNPRDCWYWLSGNCLNSSCGFRHPPLDGPAEASTEFVQSCVPVDKTSVPCYFYFNDFCNKGDWCSFLHGPEGSTPAAKSLKTTSATTTEALPLENKTCVGTETGSAPTEPLVKPPNSSETTAEIGSRAKEDLQQPSPKAVPQLSTSPQISVFEFEEALARPDLLLPAEGSIQSIYNLLSDKSSEERVDDDNVEPEERWESSPGFDVLVDDKSDVLAYDDDPDFLLGFDRDRQELSNQYVEYDYEDPDEYNCTYDHEMYDCYDPSEKVHMFDNVGRILGHSRQRMLDSLLPLKRKPLPMELAANNHNDLNLRDHLHKRRVIDSHPFTRLSRRCDSSCLIVRGPERPRRHGMGRRLHGRLTSEMTKNIIDPFREYGKFSDSVVQHGNVNLSQQNRPRQFYKERRQSTREVLSSEAMKKLVSRDRRCTQESATFKGPKTLAQIKEEKRKVQGSEDCCMKMGHSNTTTSIANFQGPKPLSEILQEKKKLGFMRNGNSSSR